MEILIIIFGVILNLIGIVGSIMPALPGPGVNFLSLIMLALLPGQQFSIEFFIIRAILLVGVQILDYFIPIRGTKKFGGTKYGVKGSTIGLIIAVIILPLLGIVIGPFGLLGLIGGPFAGAYIGEYLSGNHKKAFKSALGSFIGFVTGTLIKVVLSLIMTYYFVKAVIDIY